MKHLVRRALVPLLIAVVGNAATNGTSAGVSAGQKFSHAPRAAN